MTNVNADNITIDPYNSIFLVGQSGSGKSYLVHSLIHKLERRYGPADFHYALFDLKRVEFQREGIDYKKEYLYCDIVTDPRIALDMLDDIADTAHRRVDHGANKSPMLLVYIEECDAVVLSQERFDRAVIKINQLAEHANIKLIYSTSRVAPDTISDELLASFDAILYGPTAPEVTQRLHIPETTLAPYEFAVSERVGITA